MVMFYVIRVNIVYIYFAMYCMEFFGSFLRKVSADGYVYFDLLEKIFPLLLVYPFLMVLRNDSQGMLRKAVLAYTVYLFYGAFITFSQGNQEVVFYQLYHELKFILMIVPAMFYFADSLIKEKVIAVFKIILVFSFFVIMVRIFDASLYEILFSNGGHHEKGFIFGGQIDRYVGVFWHPSQLGIFALFSFVVLLSVKSDYLEYRKWFFLCFILILLSVQRLEIFLLFVVVISFYLVKWLNLAASVSKMVDSSYLLLGVVGVVLLILYPGQLIDWLLVDPSPRSIMYAESVHAFIGSSFLGAGWGEVGSHSAADLTDAYIYTDIGDTWWWDEGKYLYDTYWPHIIGETGIIGIFLLVLCIYYLARSQNTFELKIAWAVFVATSLMSSNMQSIFYLLVISMTLLVIRNVNDINKCE